MSARPIPDDVGNGVEGRIVPTFGTCASPLDFVTLALPDVPENAAIFPSSTIHEVSRIIRKYPIELTDFRRVESKAVVSGPRGSGLRQLTHSRGVKMDADGSLEVQIPGPLACCGQ
jgi:hypothetical protein